MPSTSFLPTQLPTPSARSDRRVRVLHLIHSACHGGIESALLNWVTHFDQERFDVRVACFAFDRNREEPFLRASREAGVEVWKVPWSITKPFFKCARAVAELVRRHEIDIVHTHGYYADAVGALAARSVAVKTVATVYVWGKYEFKRQLLQIMDQVALRFVDKVTAHCEDTARKTARRGISGERISVLFAGFPGKRAPLPPEERQRRRLAAGLSQDDYLLLNVARIDPEKAHDQLLRSFRVIHERCPRARLWICGVGSARLEEELQQLRERLNLTSSVEFLGFRQDLWSLLDLADIMVHPSHVEGVPIALCHGMAAELPIVVSDVGGVGEIIKHGQTGWLVPENDEAAFAEAVVRLIREPARARELARNARHFIQTEYSIEAAVERVAHIYDEVLGR